MMSYHHFQALCAISLAGSPHMLRCSMLLDEDDNNLFHLLYCHHLSIFHNNNFYFLLDSMAMNIQPEEVIPLLIPANCNHTFDLLDNGWCYHHACFSACQLHELYHYLKLAVSLTISTIGHLAS